MEEHLGRKLESWEHVHHVDGNKLNNDLSNLVVLSESDHHRQHGPRRTTGYWTECPNCGKKRYAVPSTNRQFCSRDCYWKMKKGSHGKPVKNNNPVKYPRSKSHQYEDLYNQLKEER